MFCTNCGAQAQDTDMFCPGCGARLKHSAAAAGSSAAGATVGNPFNEAYYQTGQSKPEKKKKANAGAGVIVVLMFAVILAMLLFAASRGYLGDSLAGLFSGCFVEDTVPVNGETDTELEPEQDTDSLPVVSDGDAEAVTTTATTTTTTTTTEKPTTTTTVNVKKQQAEEIRKLLVAKEWTTELEGYKATIKFKNDGTATISIKVLFMTQTINAQYSVNDECHAVIIGEYGGNTYGISGIISKSSDTKLIVDRDKNMGKVTLTAK